MNNTSREESSQSFSPSKKGKRRKLYSILLASSLAVALIAAAVFIARPSRTERFRRDLLEAIEKNDRQSYFDAMSHVSLGEVNQFRNKEEQLAVQEAQELMLQIWLKKDKTLWNDKGLEKRTIVSVILTSGSPEWGGTGLAEIEEGFELVKKAIEKLEEKYPSRPNSEMFIRREEGGTVIIGSRSYSRRTRP